MKLSELRALAAARTKGEWVNDYWSGQCHLNHAHGRAVCKYEKYLAKNDISHQYISVNDPERPYQVVTTTDEYGALEKEDGEFIAAMANHADRLLDLWEAFASVASEEGVREMLLSYVQGARALEALDKLEGEAK